MTLVDLELVNLEGLDFRVRCESVLHAAELWPAHDAHWWATSPCGATLAVCDARRNLCREHGCWRCTLPNGGCELVHQFEDILWEPVVQNA